MPYTGTDIDADRYHPLGISIAVVEKLMENYLGGRHILYTD